MSKTQNTHITSEQLQRRCQVGKKADQIYRINEATDNRGQSGARERYAITPERWRTLKELVPQFYLFISFKEAI